MQEGKETKGNGIGIEMLLGGAGCCDTAIENLTRAIGAICMLQGIKTKDLVEMMLKDNKQKRFDARMTLELRKQTLELAIKAHQKQVEKYAKEIKSIKRKSAKKAIKSSK